MRSYVAIVLVALILTSCSKDITTPVVLQPKHDIQIQSSFITKALTWYHASAFNTRQLTPNKIKWQELRLLKETDKYRLAVVPVLESIGYNKQLIIRDSAGVLRGIFTETFVKDLKSTVNIYNSDGGYVMTFHYDAGRYKGKTTVNFLQSETAKAPPIELPEVVITGDNVNSAPSVPTYGGFPVVYVPHNDPGNGPGSNGGGGTYVPTGPGHGGIGSATSTFRLITNNTTSPCISATVNSIMNSNFKTSIPVLLYNIFGVSNSSYTVEFTEAMRADNNLGTTTTLRIDYFEINLNTRLLQNSSKELIAATIFHEIMHAVFEVRRLNDNSFTKLSWNEYFQHQIMATKYVDPMATSLVEMFPGLDRSDALALSWEGLQETKAWRDYANQYPREANDILLKGDQFEAGNNKGTRCN